MRMFKPTFLVLQCLYQEYFLDEVHTNCIDGMLEHAVMHPIRHGYQLEMPLARG
ncbi:MAG: hypothetical protein GY835_27130 [bacterium]|nr:hypothetical protein [bacterium]